MKTRKKRSPATASRAARLRRALRRDGRALVRGLYANLRGGALSAAVRAPEPRAWRVSPGQLILVIAAALLVTIGLQLTFYGLSAQFNWHGLRAEWIDLPIYLLAGWLAMRFAARRLEPLTLPIALYAAGIVVGVGATLLAHLVLQLPAAWIGWAWVGVYYGSILWFAAAAVFLFRRTARLAWRHVAVAMAPLVLLTVYGLAWPPSPLWYEPAPPVTEARAPRASPVSEEVLYLQPRLTRETIAAIEPQRPGIPDLYFVGFAPYARQDVFLKESEVIRALFDERFDTRGRSMLLVNNDRTLREYPLATVTNLGRVLKAIGERIDPREDVVMIYLTSHGSEDHRLSVRFWPLRLQQLDPARLKELLDEAGIHWRVVVVSACYSGGFVEPLRAPTALVMTAASATRTSFGCGAESDFTYFAKALFDEQLRRTYSFEEAFARAVPVIREREQAQGQEFSDPQIAMGKAIGERLAAIERRLETLAAP